MWTGVIRFNPLFVLSLLDDRKERQQKRHYSEANHCSRNLTSGRFIVFQIHHCFNGRHDIFIDDSRHGVHHSFHFFALDKCGGNEGAKKLIEQFYGSSVISNLVEPIVVSNIGAGRETVLSCRIRFVYRRTKWTDILSLTCKSNLRTSFYD